ncbi:uncharacterized protein LOC120282787 isoform X2 [Dioscorea cayenensis subsp. rotundata]|uniref:Uncharacterized protein LOC120282787 isoform X2 n=1 Tax=Dioscorea cayennensis subsp. rotundata TaxID=55577 RepID=A0AB40D2F0_DIOCR|nr:uncharacterized protein LOC120282787 isoform X2 [Dioscorea cayenensis subsp. rotundata]
MVMERPWKRQSLSLNLDEFGRDTDMIRIDRISKLPDAFLLQILSFLQMPDVMQMCCVLTRWNHLWNSALCIDFTKAKIRTTTKFIRAVNKARNQCEGLQIREFQACVEPDLCPINSVGYWIAVTGWSASCKISSILKSSFSLLLQMLKILKLSLKVYWKMKALMKQFTGNRMNILLMVCLRTSEIHGILGGICFSAFYHF